jgi:hypothetical protein
VFHLSEDDDDGRSNNTYGFDMRRQTSLSIRDLNEGKWSERY